MNSAFSKIMLTSDRLLSSITQCMYRDTVAIVFCAFNIIVFSTESDQHIHEIDICI